MCEPLDICLPAADIASRRELVASCSRLENPRPLAHLFSDPPFYCRLAGVDLQQTYRDPHAMIRSQLLGWKTILEQVDCDVPGVSVGLVFGSFLTASNYGCQVMEQPGSIPGFHPWFSGAADLAKLERIDARSNGYEAVQAEFFHRVRELADQYPVRYQGGEVEYPARSARINTFSEGPFTIACMIAGLDQLSMWCYEEPQLVHQMLGMITHKEIERLEHCFVVMGEARGEIAMADDYSPYVSMEMYEQFVLPYQKKLRNAFPGSLNFHSCIPDPRLVSRWDEALHIGLFNGFKPQAGLHNVRTSFAPVAKRFANRIVLETDLDGANMMVASEASLREAVRTTCELFAPGKGLKIGATLCGGHRPDDMAKMNAIKATILALHG